MKRSYFHHDGLRFSYLDSGGDLPAFLLLHAHWMGASDFEDVAPAFTDRWRVIALDQRGHGETSHGGVHSIEAYVGDIDAFLAHLGIAGPVVILGHSFGGMVANLYAAARPERVRALIMEDIDIARDDHTDFVLDWAGVHPTREALEAKMNPRLVPYLARSIIRSGEGWRLNFDPQEFLRSEQVLNGDHWPQWLSHTCPALIIRGARSRIVSGEALEEMARRRPNTRIVTVDAGHSVHIDRPAEFIVVLRAFLDSLPQGEITGSNARPG
jgi:esterase